MTSTFWFGYDDKIAELKLFLFLCLTMLITLVFGHVIGFACKRVLSGSLFHVS